MENSSQPILIFDFDGTIADTLKLLVRISNQLADEFKYEKVKDSEIEWLKTKNIVDIVRHLKIPAAQMPVLLFQVRRQMRQHITQAPIAEGLKNVLLQIHSRGYQMGILSSNSRSNVDLFLKHHSIECFTFFQTSVGILGKTRRLNQVIHRYGLPRERLIYVADEIRDIQAARETKIRIAAVGWGYNHPDVLAAHNPDHLFSHPQELLKLIS